MEHRLGEYAADVRVINETTITLPLAAAKPKKKAKDTQASLALQCLPLVEILRSPD